MKKRTQFATKLFAVILAAMMLFSQITPAFAENITGPIEPTGPQITVGPNEPIGPQTAVGPIEPIGPQITTVNSQTGPDSNNQNTVNEQTTTDINVQNETNVTNEINADLNTGENTVSSNTVTGDIKTGDINGQITVINAPEANVSANTAVSNITPNSTGATTLSPLNLTTGPDSNNTNTVNDNNIVRVVDQNTTNLNNDANINANTGANQVQNNTKVGNISTGDINLAVNLINLIGLNSPVAVNLALWNLAGNVVGDIIVPENAITGPNSNNTNTVNSNNNTDVTVANNNDIQNNLTINTNTGENNLGSNTASENLTTGSTNVKTAITNIVAAPVIYIVNVFGKIFGKPQIKGVDPKNIIVNQITGPNSNNTNTVNSNNNTDINLQNNTNINNDIQISANTGHNLIGNNTVTGNIKTGSINIAASIANVMDSFSNAAGQFTFGIINIFGDWGKKSTSKTYAANSLTGPNSNNINNIDINNNFRYEETCNINVSNKTKIDANTGENEISSNTVVGNISTGDINIDLATKNSVSCAPIVEKQQPKPKPPVEKIVKEKHYKSFVSPQEVTSEQVPAIENVSVLPVTGMNLGELLAVFGLITLTIYYIYLSAKSLAKR